MCGCVAFNCCVCLRGDYWRAREGNKSLKRLGEPQCALSKRVEYMYIYIYIGGLILPCYFMDGGL